jgi:hypothetical protein
MMKISKLMLKIGCHIPGLKGSPRGETGQEHHVADKSLSLTFDPVARIVWFEGWGQRRWVPVENVAYADPLIEQPAKMQQPPAKGAA